uniref:Predicted protein n=1 Tax=Hordeum vulgare subsp. vulgare TaxID=112509 RepID=F2E216_HORVV|nr:predicted protein [Hordeum vulgare subsp. vulgare]
MSSGSANPSGSALLKQDPSSSASSSSSSNQSRLRSHEHVVGNSALFSGLVVYAILAVIAGVVWNIVDPRQKRYGPQTMFAIAAVLLLCKVVWVALVKLVLTNTRGSRHGPSYDPVKRQWAFSNFAHNQVFHPSAVFEPADLDELLRIVQDEARHGKRVRAVGSLHSWSGCAVTNDGVVRMDRLNHVLHYDLVKKRVTAQCGIKLSDLYTQMDEKGLALPTLPNVDSIQLGGAVANATHGTNITVGTFSSQVTDLQIVLFRDSSNGLQASGRAELVTLSRDDANTLNWFEAAIASFGCLGIIYSITLQCVDSYVSYVSEKVLQHAEVEGHVAEIAKRYPACQMTVFPSNATVLTKIQVPMSDRLVPTDATSITSDRDLLEARFIFFANQPNAKTFKFLRRLVGAFVHWAFSSSVVFRAWSVRRRAAVMHWTHAEIMNRVTAALSIVPWINLEYAIPIENADGAYRQLVQLLRRYPTVSVFAMRPVGSDDYGHLSPTQGRQTVFFDVPYNGTLEHTGVYGEVEKLLLSHGGRCSWSRLFKAPPSEVVRQYPRFSRFKAAKQQMDPFNVFGNAFSDAILDQSPQTPNI